MFFFGLFGQKVSIDDLKAKLRKVQAFEYHLDPRKDGASTLEEFETILTRKIAKLQRKADRKAKIDSNTAP